MFSVIAISTVKFRHNCLKTKISTSQGQLIIDAPREEIDPITRIELHVIERGEN